ncbi:2-methylcitrate synthase, partial [Campylobacter coli]|nr:2-methylcitrate synthase [Campylobacter coli]
FEEIAYLLQFGELPNAKELENYKEKIIAQRALSENLKNVLKAISKEVHPMNLMQTAVAALGALEGENEDFSD